MSGLDEKEIHRDPIRQFQIWLDDAIAANIPLAEAMTLATATPDGRPAARMVLLKQVDQNGFVFFTNYRSAKARQLDANPYAAVVFYWNLLERQVRVEGSVVRTSAEESREYFQTRPRESQIGAWASKQSEELASRDELEQRVAAAERKFAGAPVPRPPFWSGFRLTPERIEFWSGRTGRLHHRELFERQGTDWRTSLRYP